MPALVLAGAVAMLASAGDAVPAAGGHERAVSRADADADKVFDRLERRLAPKSARAKVRVIVTLTADATAKRVEGVERQVGELAVSDRFSVIDAFAATATKGQVRELANSPAVAHVEEDAVVRALNDAAQDSFGVSQARADSPGVDGNADANVETYSKDDLVAAVIDSGIDATHPDLDEGKVLGFADCTAPVCAEGPPKDSDGHGTHVAGTIAGEGDARADRRYRGVAPGGALVGVQVLGPDGTGTQAGVIRGIEWALANKDRFGIEAINLSVGVDGCWTGGEADSQAVGRAHDAGLVAAVAAGNEGPGTCTVGSPGAAPKALTVGAMADTGENGFSQASFSSRGRTADGRIKPDVSAPGVRITSARATVGVPCDDPPGRPDPAGYDTCNGTSMATPFTTGVALLMRDAAPALTSQQLKDKVMATAVDWGRGGDNRALGSRGPDIDYGAGRLDAYAAIRSGAGTPPPVPAHGLGEGSLAGPADRVDYRLNVTDTSSPIAATMIMPAVSGRTATSPDFDLYLLDPNGAPVRDPSGAPVQAETIRRQESIGFRPATTGTYTLRVRSHSGSGGYFVDISAGLGGPMNALGYPYPPVTLTSPAPGSSTADSTPIFGGGAGTAPGDSPAVGVRVYDGASASGTPVQSLGATRSGGAWSVEAASPLAPGTYTARAEQADASGNVVSSAPSTFTVRSPTPTPTPGPPVPRDLIAPAMTVSRRTVVASSRGIMGLRVGCPAAEPGGCFATARLVATPPARAGRKRPRRASLGRRSFQVRGGTSTVVRFRLSRRNMRLLRRVRTLRVAATVVARDAAGNQGTTRGTFRLRAPRRRR